MWLTTDKAYFERTYGHLRAIVAAVVKGNYGKKKAENFHKQSYLLKILIVANILNLTKRFSMAYKHKLMRKPFELLHVTYVWCGTARYERRYF
jgi:hypothetical protein